MNHIKKALVALTSITLLSGLTACGDAEPAAAPTTVVTVTASAEPTASETLPEEADVEYLPEEDLTAVVYDESQIINHLGLDHNNEILTSDGVWCEASAILNSAGSVDLYADAGDVVAAAPMGTAGVKVGGAEQRTCLAYFTDALADFPEGSTDGVEVPEHDSAAEPVQLSGEELKAQIGAHLGLGEGGVVTTPDGVECDAAYAIYDETTLNEATWEGEIIAVNADGYGVSVEGFNANECRDYFVLAMQDFTPQG